MKVLTKKDAQLLFQQIDTRLGTKNRKITITLLGGLAVILQEFRERSTIDIDIAPTKDAPIFVRLCQEVNIPVDIITVASTVDLIHAPTVNQFTGQYLSVESITAEDLIRLKLERFYKQDPEDIFAIIQKIALPYERFQGMVSEMLKDFIGNPRGLVLSALEVVERIYPDSLEIFQSRIAKITQ